MNKELTGIIEEIQETKTYPKKSGEGTVTVTKLKIAGKYMTCFFSENEIKEMKVGEEVDVVYVEKENEYEGKKYINYNISAIMPKLGGSAPAPTPTPQPTGNVSENTILIGTKKYRATFEEIQ